MSYALEILAKELSAKKSHLKYLDSANKELLDKIGENARIVSTTEEMIAQLEEAILALGGTLPESQTKKAKK